MQDHVAMIIRDKNNQELLFIRRSLSKQTLPGIWSFPSGTVEAGEAVEQTAIRETQEELGIIVTPLGLLATTELPEFNVRLHFLLTVLSAGIPTIRQPEEMSELLWLSFTEFFHRFNDNQIGHGLIWLRPQPQLWQIKIEESYGTRLEKIIT